MFAVICAGKRIHGPGSVDRIFRQVGREIRSAQPKRQEHNSQRQTPQAPASLQNHTRKQNNADDPPEQGIVREHGQELIEHRIAPGFINKHEPLKIPLR